MRADGRVALNAHQTAAIIVWTCEVLGFHLLLAPSIDDDGRAPRDVDRARMRVFRRGVRVRRGDGDRPGMARDDRGDALELERGAAVLSPLRLERRSAREALPRVRQVRGRVRSSLQVVE